MVFTGTYQRTLDEKGRIALPKVLRDELANESSLFSTPGTERCLELHHAKSLNELAARTAKSKTGSQNLKAFSRLFYARAEQCEIDRSGRIRLSPALIEHADLVKEIVIIGVGSNWEVWEQNKWQSYLLENQAEFDRLTQNTFDMIPIDGSRENSSLSSPTAIENREPE